MRLSTIQLLHGSLPRSISKYHHPPQETRVWYLGMEFFRGFVLQNRGTQGTSHWSLSSFSQYRYAINGENTQFTDTASI
jgi:hypothetical protein